MDFSPRERPDAPSTKTKDTYGELVSGYRRSLFTHGVKCGSFFTQMHQHSCLGQTTLPTHQVGSISTAPNGGKTHSLEGQRPWCKCAHRDPSCKNQHRIEYFQLQVTYNDHLDQLPEPLIEVLLLFSLSFFIFHVPIQVLTIKQELLMSLLSALVRHLSIASVAGRLTRRYW